MKAERLKKNREFRRVYQKKNTVSNEFLVLYKAKNNLGFNRIGICVSKKIGNAVVRNRLRRLIKENERDIPWEKQGFDMIFLARVPSSKATYQEIHRSMYHLLRRCEMIGTKAVKKEEWKMQ